MCKQIVKDTTIQAVLKSNKAKALLMTAFDMSEDGIRKMLKRKDIVLTAPMAVQAMMEGTGLKENELFDFIEEEA